MSDPQQYLDILEQLDARTDRGEVHWRQGGEGAVFVPFDEYSLILNPSDPGDGPLSLWLVLRNYTGEAIDKVLITKDHETFELVNHLYAKARRQALGIDRALEQISQTLRQAGPIGTSADEGIRF